MKFNTNGAVKADKSAGCGGVLRDRNGSWITGFCSNLGTLSPLHTELTTIRTTVEIVIDITFPLVIIEVDLLEAINQINVDVLTNNVFVSGENKWKGKGLENTLHMYVGEQGK